MPKTLLLLGGGVLGVLGRATLAMSMRTGSLSPADPPLPPPPADWPTPPPTRAAILQREAERRPGLEQRWTDAEKRGAADPRLRLPELLDRLTARGFQPRIAFTWRALATQDDLVAQKRSQVTFSFHNAVMDGAPAALAADVVDGGTLTIGVAGTTVYVLQDGEWLDVAEGEVEEGALWFESVDAGGEDDEEDEFAEEEE